MGDLAQKPLLEKAPTTHAGLLAWVEEVAELTQPDRIYWVDGSEEENTRLTDELVAAGTLTRLNPELFPNSFAAFSDPADVARVEEQTFICSRNERDAGFTQRAFGNPPLYKPEFWQRVQYLDENGNKEDTTFSCFPPGVPRLGPPMRIVQTDRDVVLMYQNRNMWRVVPTAP